MRSDGISLHEKTKRPAGTTILYIAAWVVGAVAIALLVNNIMLYNNTYNSYIAQGYPADVILKQLVASQLIPGILDPIAVYGGIALTLYGVGLINRKVSSCRTFSNEPAEEPIFEEAVPDLQAAEADKPEETVEKTDENSDNIK